MTIAARCRHGDGLRRCASLPQECLKPGERRLSQSSTSSSDATGTVSAPWARIRLPVDGIDPREQPRHIPGANFDLRQGERGGRFKGRRKHFGVDRGTILPSEGFDAGRRERPWQRIGPCGGSGRRGAAVRVISGPNIPQNGFRRTIRQSVALGLTRGGNGLARDHMLFQ
jgi:hypothetical protein